MTVLDKAGSGFFAAFFSSLVLCPTELIKCKLQAINETKSMKMSASALTKSIVKEHGFKGLFNGLGSTIVREMPGYFAFFLGIEGTRRLMLNYTNFKDESHPLVSLASGAAGGISLWLTIFPFDMIKSRIQVENSTLGLIPMMRKVIREEGARNLYRGLTPTLVRTVPATAALLVVVEKTKLIMLC